jgi:hypothetical protein
VSWALQSTYDINKKEQVLSYFNGRVRDPQLDLGKRWKTTWNYYLNRINLFFIDIQLPFAASDTGFFNRRKN